MAADALHDHSGPPLLSYIVLPGVKGDRQIPQKQAHRNLCMKVFPLSLSLFEKNVNQLDGLC